MLSMTITFSKRVKSTALPTIISRKSAHTLASLTRKFLMVAPLVSAKKSRIALGVKSVFIVVQALNGVVLTIEHAPKRMPCCQTTDA